MFSQAVEFFSSFGTVKMSEYYDSEGELGWDPTLSRTDGSLMYVNLGTGSPSNNYMSNSSARTPVPTCAYLNAVGGVVSSTTARNLCFGSEYWGTFTRAWYTLFQILTYHAQQLGREIHACAEGAGKAEWTAHQANGRAREAQAHIDLGPIQRALIDRIRWYVEEHKYDILK